MSSHTVLTGSGRKCGYSYFLQNGIVWNNRSGSQTLKQRPPPRENKQEVTLLEFSCMFTVSKEFYLVPFFFGLVMRGHPLSPPGQTLSLLHCQLVGLPEISLVRFDALDGLNTAEMPFSYLCLHLPPFCQMSLRICSKKNLLQVFSILG